MDTTTNPEIGQTATQTDAVEMQGTLLLGLVSSPNGPRALLRHSNGKVETVAPGDKTRAGLVTAIGGDKVVLLAHRREVILTMPAG